MSQHHPTRIYRGLRRRLARVLSLADSENRLRECRLEGSREYFRQPYERTRQERHKALNDVERMLRGLERSGALTRPGAYLIASVFACAAYSGVNPLSQRGQRLDRNLRLAWKFERFWHLLHRSRHRSAS